jgi:hypothetical protein
MVERSPEKAGVGGSIPSLATIPFNNFREQGSSDEGLLGFVKRFSSSDSGCSTAVF